MAGSGLLLTSVLPSYVLKFPLAFLFPLLPCHTCANGSPSPRLGASRQIRPVIYSFHRVFTTPTHSFFLFQRLLTQILLTRFTGQLIFMGLLSELCLVSKRGLKKEKESSQVTDQATLRRLDLLLQNARPPSCKPCPGAATESPDDITTEVPTKSIPGL